MIIFQLWEKDFLKEPSSVYTVLQNSELNKIRLSTLIPYLNLKTVALPSPPLSTDDEKFINNVVVTLDNILKVSFFVWATPISKTVKTSWHYFMMTTWKVSSTYFLFLLRIGWHQLE